MSRLTCPLCGEEQDPSGPSVSSYRDADGAWKSSWTPFIEDLRGTPQRRGHPSREALLEFVAERLATGDPE